MRSLARLAAPVAIAALVLGLGPWSAVGGAESAPALDPTYGTDGVLEVRAGDSGGSPVSLDDAVRDDAGRLLVAGDPVQGLHPVVMRFTSRGVLDPTFSDDGVQELPEDLNIHGLVVDGDVVVLHGEVVDVVEDPFGISRTNALMRLLDDGSIDTAFGEDGVLILTEPWVPVQAVAAAGGRIVIARGGPIIEDGEVTGVVSIVSAFLPDGRLDGAFGQGGTVTIGDGTDPTGEAAGAVAFDDSGRLVLAATTTDLGTPIRRTHSLRRLRPDGSLDETFGSSGSLDLGQGHASELELNPFDGSIFVRGAHGPDDVNYDSVTKVTAAGALDTTFGDGGVASLDVAPQSWWQSDMEVDSSGHVMVAGTSGADHGYTGVIVRLTPAGRPDRFFGETGRHLLPGMYTVAIVLDRHDRLLYAAQDWRSSPSEVGGQVWAMRLDTVAPAPLITQVEARPGALSVSWVPGSPDPISPTRAYLVLALEAGAVRGYAAVAADVAQASIPGLANGVEHDVVVYAYNRHGAGLKSGPASGMPAATASPVAAPGAVGELSAVPGRGFITVSWSPPTDDGGAPVLGYSVLAVRKSTGTVAAWRNVPADLRRLSLSGLVDGADHDVYVLAHSARGFGEIAPPTTTSPATSGPIAQAPEVSWSSVVPISPSQAVVTWGPQRERGDSIRRFHVVVMKDGVMTAWSALGPSARQAVMPAPAGATVYVFTDSASGWGPFLAEAVPG